MNGERLMVTCRWLNQGPYSLLNQKLATRALRLSTILHTKSGDCRSRERES